MKIAISTYEENLNSAIDQRFGRCRYFLIVDLDKKDVRHFEAVANKGNIQGHGAGIKAAEQLGELGIDAIITGQLGPNASEILKKLGIKAYSASGMIKTALDNFADGKLQLITESSEPHPENKEKKQVSGERIFFPLLDDKGMDSEISSHFGHAPFFGIYDTAKKELKIIPNDLDHTDPAKSPIDQIEEAVDPTTIFAKGIGGRAIAIIQQKGLSLKTGDYSTVKEAVENLDNLEDQTESCGHVHNH